MTVWSKRSLSLRKVFAKSSCRRRGRSLWFESLELRRVLAQATGVTYTFREDEFSINGTFTYQQSLPQEFDYIDTINNGRYTNTTGTVKWTSATIGTGKFTGTATGDGRDTVKVGIRRNCSEYGIEEKGRMEFSLNAQTSTLKMESVDSESTGYTYYRDLTGGQCPPTNPPWPRFFGGTIQNYTGTFNPSTHRVAVHYSQTNPAVTVDAPSTDLTWKSTAATDMSLTASATGTAPQVPDGFIGVPQSTEPPATLPFIDPSTGSIKITVNVSGKPARTSTPQTPVATIKAFWAASESDTAGAEIPINSNAGPVGLFWNSSQLIATIGQLPEPPPTARFIRITVSAPTAVDANAANSTKFLPLGDFQARNSAGNSASEDEAYDGSNESVLHPLDRADPAIKVFGYRGTSELGANVEVFDDGGAFTYDPTFLSSVQALGVGETLNDTVHFIAIKSQTLLSDATFTIPVRGENDLPIANDDLFAATNFHSLTMLPSQLLNNDQDPDRNDGVRLKSIVSVTALGATVTAVMNQAQTEITEITYDPTTSATLRALATGQKVQDNLSYEIVDLNGGEAGGGIIVEVTGEERFLSIAPVAPQYTIAGVATALIPLLVEDPDGDPSDVRTTATSADTNLAPSSGLEIVQQGGEFFLRITPASATGRTTITLTANNSAPHVATRDVLLVVGTETDLDLDGIDNQVEDAAPHSGDLNQDGIADSRQANVTSFQAGGGTFVNLVVPEDQFLVDVISEQSPNPAGAASAAQFPIGLVRFEVLAPSGATSNVEIRTNSTTILNRVFQFDEQSGWSSLMHNKRDGARIFADRITISVVDGKRGDLGASTDGIIVAAIGLGQVLHPWQNLVREDIDNDGVVAPLDALQLINQLNNFGSRSLGSLPADNLSLPNFLDPSGNDSLEPIDALIVINFLNNVAAESEAEAGVLRIDTRSMDEPSRPSRHHGSANDRRDPLPVVERQVNREAMRGRRRAPEGSAAGERPAWLHFRRDLDAILASEESLDELSERFWR